MTFSILCETLVVVSGLMLAYIYLGYPLLIMLLSRHKQRTASQNLDLPSVSLIISAYNERESIRSKLENSLALKYPKDRLEIIVVSDCSNDGTDEIVREFASSGVRLVHQEPRMGKTAGLNLAVPQTKGQIVVFSDANALYVPDAIQKLVRHFGGPKVGYVVGNAQYSREDQPTEATRSEGLYWDLECRMKQWESQFYSVVGGDGAIYAIRRELYTPLGPTDINDFLNPLQIIAKGYVGVFEPAALSFERAAGNFRDEFSRKTRIISRSLRAVTQVPGVLLPSKNTRFWFMLMSHKVLRWFAPCFMCVLLASSLALWEILPYRILALGQMAFYALAIVGWFLEGKVTTRILYLPCYFCLVNLAALVGIGNFLTGNLSGTWNPARAKSGREVPNRP